jgi:hypothetical protein
LADRRANPALEFALVAPILIILFFAVYDFSSGLIVYQEVYNAAHSIPASASIMAVTGGTNGATNLTYQQIQVAESEIWAQMPSLRSGFRDPSKSVTISSVVFELTNSSCVPSASPKVPCNYTPYVVWSVAYAGGDSTRSFNNVLRSCTTTLNQSASNAGSASDMTNIRTAGVTTPDPYVSPPSPILVVDVNVKYIPVFGTSFGPINFWSTGFWPVRSVQATQDNAQGVPEPLTLNEQFTTITASSLTSAPAAGYCVSANPGKILTPPGPTT